MLTWVEMLGATREVRAIEINRVRRLSALAEIARQCSPAGEEACPPGRHGDPLLDGLRRRLAAIDAVTDLLAAVACGRAEVVGWSPPPRAPGPVISH